mmetsp:Transcript_57408/g.171241  ORF Transcript_57408/g.171241 Transcript_57408/m.171241 type:complete len:289 (-) Transcript_57408:40-906(-)
MTRKSKQPGGHNPLTYAERKKLTSYGTATARLSTDSQRKFGDCCLGLEPARDPVATPSGHIYSREAIVSYLLQKNKELKALRAKYDAQLALEQKRKAEEEEDTKERAIVQFAKKDQGAAQQSESAHSQSLAKKIGSKISTESTEEGKDTLKRTSYWLSEYQPEYDDSETSLLRAGPPPDRPLSPMSGNPLRLKDLIPLDLAREGEGRKGKVVCAVSGKAITTQRAIVIKKTGKVMLYDMYEKLAKPSMTCPATGKKFKQKDVIELKKAASGFAASGQTIAKRYRPTLT